MKRPAVEIHQLDDMAIYTIVLPTNTPKGTMCGCVIKDSVCLGGQLKSKVLQFRRAGMQVKVFAYDPKIQVKYSVNEVTGRPQQEVFVEMPEEAPKEELKKDLPKRKPGRPRKKAPSE